MTTKPNPDAERLARLRAWGDTSRAYRDELADSDIDWLIDRAEEALQRRAAAEPEACRSCNGSGREGMVINENGVRVIPCAVCGGTS